MDTTRNDTIEKEANPLDAMPEVTNQEDSDKAKLLRTCKLVYDLCFNMVQETLNSMTPIMPKKNLTDLKK